MTAATFMVRLYWFWTQVVPSFDMDSLPEIQGSFVYRYETAGGNINMYKIGDHDGSTK